MKTCFIFSVTIIVLMLQVSCTNIRTQRMYKLEMTTSQKGQSEISTYYRDGEKVLSTIMYQRDVASKPGYARHIIFHDDLPVADLLWTDNDSAENRKLSINTTGKQDDFFLTISCDKATNSVSGISIIDRESLLFIESFKLKNDYFVPIAGGELRKWNRAVQATVDMMDYVDESENGEFDEKKFEDDLIKHKQKMDSMKSRPKD